MATDVATVFAETQALTAELMGKTTIALETATTALSDAGIYAFEPYDFQQPTMIFGNPVQTLSPPQRPLAPNLDVLPKVQEIISVMPTTPIKSIGTVPARPNITTPSKPSTSIGSAPTAPTATAQLQLPSKPTMLPLSSTVLPYPTVTMPNVPAWSDPSFVGTAPTSIQTISMNEYLALLTSTYAKYASSMPSMVQSNWRAWYSTMLQDHPMVATLQGVLTSYFNTGGAGIPITIESAIVTRAQDKVTGEQRRATKKVWEEAAKRGLWMPSGALAAGLKEAAQLSAEATSKVVTDVAIKNLELEHDHMKFMLTAAETLEKTLQDTSVGIARGVIEINGQAVEITKTVLQGMVAVNDAIVKVYLAQWEGYKAAVEKYRADIQVIQAKVQLYEAEIRAELAKTEVNKSVVAVLDSIVRANQSIVQMYKTQIDAETAKLEVDRVKALLYESQVRGYVGTVDAFRARWDGYKSEVEATLAQSQVYEAQVRGYSAGVGAYSAEVAAYGESCRAVGIRAEAIGKSNQAELAAWTAKADGLLRAFGENMRAFATEWQAKVAEAQINGEYYKANVGAITAYNATNIQQQMEMGRQHLVQWQTQLESALRAAQGLKEISAVWQNIASSSLSGLTAFAGQFVSQ